MWLKIDKNWKKGYFGKKIEGKRRWTMGSWSNVRSDGVFSCSANYHVDFDINKVLLYRILEFVILLFLT